MTTIEELKQKHARELAEAEQEIALIGLLPVEPTMVCVHKNFFSVEYGKKFPERYRLNDAVRIMQKFESMIVPMEAWRHGCVSIRPAEINEYASKDGAKHDFTAYACVELNAGQGYDAHKLAFWIKTDMGLANINIEISPPFNWLPDCRWSSRDVEKRTWSVIPNGFGEDKFLKFWSPQGAYDLKYYWLTKESFSSINE